MSGRDFWSQRRAAVEAEEQAAEMARAEAAEAAEMARLEDRDDAEILAELNLPDPDTLKLGDDVRAFMARAVPERLRRRALRRLWQTNPVLACVDGLNDYDGDFTGTGGVVKTSYQVGKGLLAHIEEMARQAEAAAEPPAAESAPEPAPEPAATADAEPAAETRQLAAAEEPAETASPPAGPRRMRFDFQV